MATDVTMPRLSDSMEEGTVLKWLVEEGGEVKRGEPLVEIETDKANMTYEADTDGTLIEIVAQEGDTLAIGEPIARIGDPSEAGERKPRRRAQAEEKEPPTRKRPRGRGGGRRRRGGAARRGRAPAAEDGDERRPPRRASPAAAVAEATAAARPSPATATKERAPSGNGAGRRASRRRRSRAAWRASSDVELARLEGSGPGGRIVKADVQAAAESGAPGRKRRRGDGAKPDRPPRRRPQRAAEERPEPQRGEAGPKGEAEIQELTRLQQTVSRRMAESKATAPDFSISLTVDMTEAVELRKRLKEVSDPAPSFNDMVVKAAATALREHPRVNGAYRDGKFELYERVNIGVAVAAQDALVVPTVFDADRKSLGQIARDARAVAEKVRDKTVTPPELSGGTFTVSNLGMFGIEQFTAIINPPQAAILTVGALAKQPAVDESGRIVARDQMPLSLVCDHRILYGADGAQFLARVKELLEQPLSLAL